MEKRLQEAVATLNFRLEECTDLPDRGIARILVVPPQQRTTEQLAHLARYVRRLALFRQLLLAKPHKYKEIVAALGPYWEARNFRTGEAITITGAQSKYVNILIDGKAHIFVPKNEQAYTNSITNRNSKRRKNLSELIGKRQELPPINRTLTIDDAAKLLKEREFVNELFNPHVYLQTAGEGLKVGAQPLRWTCKGKYDDCTAICSEPCICLSVRWEVYSEIAAYRQYIKKRTSIRLLLNFFKGLKYEEVVRYTAGSPTTAYEDKQEIHISNGQLYLVAEGEVVSCFIPEEEAREEELELLVAPASKRPRPLCRSYQGQLIGGEDLPQIRFFSHERSKILRLDPSLLSRDMSCYPALAEQIRSLVETRKQFLMRSIELCENASKQLSIQKRMEEVQVTERRNVADLGVMEALKTKLKKGSSYKQFIESCQITRGDNEVSVVVQHGRHPSKSVRCKKLAETENERELFLKLGFLNQEQIVRHNSELLRRRVNNGDLEELNCLVQPLGGSKKSAIIEPPRFPSVNLYSKRCSLRLRCILNG